jgi:hypothetical protein
MRFGRQTPQYFVRSTSRWLHPFLVGLTCTAIVTTVILYPPFRDQGKGLAPHMGEIGIGGSNPYGMAAPVTP